MPDEEPLTGVFNEDATQIQIHTVVSLDEGDVYVIARSSEFVDYTPGGEVDAPLEFLVDLGSDDGAWTTNPSGSHYRFSSRHDAEFVMQRIVGLRQGMINSDAHAAEIRLSCILADLHMGGGTLSAELVQANDILQLNKIAVTVQDEDPVEMFLLVHLTPNNVGTVRRRFLCTRSSASSERPEWTENLNEARYFFTRSHALDSAHWILEKGSVGYHTMGNPGDTLYQQMFERRNPRLQNLQFTDDEGREASLCFIQAKTKSITKTGLKRDVSGVDDSKSSETMSSDPEMARWMFKNRAVYVYLLVQFDGEELGRYKVDSFSRSDDVYSVSGREIIGGSAELGDSLHGTVVDHNRRRELSNDEVVLVDSGSDHDVFLEPADYLDADDSEE